MVNGFGPAADALRLVAGCATDQRLLLSPGRSEYFVEFRTPAPLSADGLLRGASLEVSVVLREEGTRRPLVAGYAYGVLDHSGREQLAFHWHPIGTRSLVTFPHLHASAALRGTALNGSPAILPLDKVHLPTGHVTLVDIVRLLITELGVQPRVTRWRERLEVAGGTLPPLPSAPS